MAIKGDIIDDLKRWLLVIDDVCLCVPREDFISGGNIAQEADLISQDGSNTKRREKKQRNWRRAGRERRKRQFPAPVEGEPPTDQEQEESEQCCAIGLAGSWNRV